MAAENGQYPIFRFNFTPQDPAQLGEADKSFQQMGFAVEMAHGSDDREQGFIGIISQESRPFPQQLHHQPVEMKFLVRHTGKKAFL